MNTLYDLLKIAKSHVERNPLDSYWLGNMTMVLNEIVVEIGRNTRHFTQHFTIDL